MTDGPHSGPHPFLKHITVLLLLALYDFNEILEELRPELAVFHFRVILYSEEGAGETGYGLDLTGRRGCGEFESFRNGFDLVVVRSPNGEIVRHSREEIGMIFDVELHFSELGHVCRAQFRSEVLAHELMAGADTEDGVLRTVKIFAVVAHTVSFTRDARCATGKDETVEIRDLFKRCGVGNNLGFDFQVFQHTPLAMRPLTTVIDNVDFHVQS